VPDGRFLTSYRWTDSYGRERSLDIFVESAADPRVWVYTPDEDDRVLVALVSNDGTVSRSTPALTASGMDTAAAWNDLVEICRRARLTTT
jgi:hypothetical protein